MHVLGHSISHRRKTSKSRDLHIRKVSFSGCSLSSGSSFSLSPSDSVASASTTSSAPSPFPSSDRVSPSSRSASRDFDPLSSHPTFMPPPRLHERPLLGSTEIRASGHSSTTCFQDQELEYGTGSFKHYTFQKDDADVSRGEFSFHSHDISQRPVVLCSRWSDSTIASFASTISNDDPDSVDADQESLDERDVPDEPQEQDGQDQNIESDDVIDGYYYLDQLHDGHQSLPNFSSKRARLPKRPPIKMLDSFEDFIKRGGWKRRGIIFHCEDTDDDSGIADMSL